jgi:hypothetical protein
VGIDPAEEDIEVRTLLGNVRIATIKFATAEWIGLSPDLVIGLEESLRKLAPGETLGGAIPPAPSAKLGLDQRDLEPVPPQSHNPTSGSGVPRHTSSAPAPPPAAAVAAQKRSFVSDKVKRPADWVTVRHSPHDFSLFFLTASRLVRALPVAA